ncbi:hypothetical protein NA78x_005741 [Anatilimnocola sp. NA78]|uniref:hypothetical protein n=1 Tax=Anatilimnocola sp. NA78 TaxID=3415683 RepID=UPI003CE4FC67
MKLNLRDFLWLTAVVGLALGWWIDSRHKSAVAAEREKEISVYKSAFNQIRLIARARDVDESLQRMRLQACIEYVEKATQ